MKKLVKSTRQLGNENPNPSITSLQIKNPVSKTNHNLSLIKKSI